MWVMRYSMDADNIAHRATISFVVCITCGVCEFSSNVGVFEFIFYFLSLLQYLLASSGRCNSMTDASRPFVSFHLLFEPFLPVMDSSFVVVFHLTLILLLLLLLLSSLTAFTREHIRCIICRITLIPMNNKPRVNISHQIESNDAYDRIN